jgi:hypothetical protein
VRRTRVGIAAFLGALIVAGPAGAMPATAGRGSTPATPPRFTDVTGPAGIDVQGLGNASSWVDYDVDGDLDLLASDSDFPSDVYLYRNDGDGTFTDVTGPAGLGSAQLRSMAWADFDNDGWPDLAGTTYSSGDRTKLYRNQGDGSFVEIGAQVGFEGAGVPWRVAWADVDRNGWVDLYQANLGKDFLYLSGGDGTFRQVAAAAGVSDSANSNAAAFGDIDNDGWPDLFVGNDGADRLYRNNRDGTFTDIAGPAGVSDSSQSVSACWGDLDGDGLQDLYVVNIGSFGQNVSNHLYRNAGNQRFQEVTRLAGVGDVGDGRTCNLLDVDNDGRLDIFATNHVHPNRLYRNTGHGRFTDVAAASGIASPGDTFNGAWSDDDADGDLDVMVVGHFANVLYRNDGPAGGYVHVVLVGTPSNRSAIGARAVLLGAGLPQTRTVEGSSGAYGQDSLDLEFGVGNAEGLFRLRIWWPSGATTTLPGVLANSDLVVNEGG